MTQAISPLRQRMIEDMTIRQFVTVRCGPHVFKSCPNGPARAL